MQKIADLFGGIAKFSYALQRCEDTHIGVEVFHFTNTIKNFGKGA